MKAKINLTIDESVLRTLRELAESSHRSVSQWVTDKVLEAEKEAQEASTNASANTTKGA